MSHSFDEEYVLNMEDASCNPYGLFPLRLNDFSADGREIISALEVKMPFWDPRDFEKHKKGLAELLPDGSGFVLTIPRVPTVFLRNVDLLYDASDTLEKGMSNVHLGFVNSGGLLGRNGQAVTKKILILFPDGMQCTNEYFNEAKDPRKKIAPTKMKNYIKNKEIVVGQDAAAINIMHNMIYVKWKLKIVGPNERRLAVDQDSDDEDGQLSRHFTSAVSMSDA